jgi:hypothetical protein
MKFFDAEEKIVVDITDVDDMTLKHVDEVINLIYEEGIISRDAEFISLVEKFVPVTEEHEAMYETVDVTYDEFMSGMEQHIENLVWYPNAKY